VTPEEQARFDALERRVEELERRLNAGPAKIPLPPRAVPTTTPGVQPAAVPASRPQLETRVGVNWIGRIAVITVVLALAFFFQYAFENHWITERMRVLLGIVCGAAALGFGERFWRGGQRAYGQSLAAVGIAFFYLSFWAAFALYHLVPEAAGFAAMVLATAAAGYLALRYDSEAVMMLGLAGGVGTPLLLSGGNTPWFVLSYALLLDVGAMVVAKRRRWRWPEPLALMGTAILYLSQAPAKPFYAAFLVAYFAVFALSTQAAIFIAAQAVAGIAMVELHGLASAGLLAAAGLAVADRRRWPIAASGAFIGFWLAYLERSADSLGVLTAVFLLFLAWPLWRVLGRGAALGIVDLVLLPLNAGLYFAASYRDVHAPWIGLFVVAVAVVQAAAARSLWLRDARGALMAAGTAWVLLILAAPVQFAGYRITIVWALEAAAVVWAGVRMGERRAVIAAECLFLLVLLRLAFLDSRMYAGAVEYRLLMNPRCMAFVVSAVSLWAAAWWIRSGRMAMAAYVAGHVALLWGLGLEAIGWASRTAAPVDYRSFASTALSVLAAGYAVLLVGAGAAWKHAPTRLMGMGLIGLVVLKLYLYDVWLLGPFYRMAAFAILGALLLVMSYLYSRRERKVG
jgi:uncharacterized membrane protein